MIKIECVIIWIMGVLLGLAILRIMGLEVENARYKCITWSVDSQICQTYELGRRDQ